MTTRYRTAFMAPSGFTAAAPGATKGSKRIAPVSDRKTGAVARPQIRSPLDPKSERSGQSEAA